MKAFSVESHFNYRDQYKISLSEDVYRELTSTGPITNSLAVLAARLMGLPYNSFLEYIRQEYGAKLHGKTGKYISYSFDNKKDAISLTQELNKRWNCMMFLKNGKPIITE